QEQGCVIKLLAIEAGDEIGVVLSNNSSPIARANTARVCIASEQSLIIIENRVEPLQASMGEAQVWRHEEKQISEPFRHSVQHTARRNAVQHTRQATEEDPTAKLGRRRKHVRAL